MQLAIILVILAAILALLSGCAVFVGSRKADRESSRFFALTAFFSAFWALSMAAFLSLAPEKSDIAKLVVLGIYIPPLFMDVCLTTYACWSYKYGRTVPVITGLVAAFLAAALLYDPSLLYSDITISTSGNSVSLVSSGWLYISYSIYFAVCALASLIALFMRVKKSRNREQRISLTILMSAIAIAGLIMLYYNVIMPCYDYSFIWAGGLAISIVMILHYYTVLRYRLIVMSASWLRILSYAIIVTSAATVYMVIFYFVFLALFRVNNPSPAIFVLNFIMILFTLLLSPVLNALTVFVRSLVSIQDIDITYVIKQLSRVEFSSTNLKEVPSFLAEQLHFQYVGLLIDGKLYNSHSVQIPVDLLTKISKLPTSSHGIWYSIPESMSSELDKYDIKGIAELCGVKGKSYGQIILGKPMGKISFKNRDLSQIEIVIMLLATIVDSRRH